MGESFKVPATPDRRPGQDQDTPRSTREDDGLSSSAPPATTRPVTHGPGQTQTPAHTIAEEQDAVQATAGAERHAPLRTSNTPPLHQPHRQRPSRTLSAGLHLQTDLSSICPSSDKRQVVPPQIHTRAPSTQAESGSAPSNAAAATATSSPTRVANPHFSSPFSPALRASLSTNSMGECYSPGALSSPALAAALNDMTPLPSPIYYSAHSPKRSRSTRSTRSTRSRPPSMAGIGGSGDHSALHRSVSGDAKSPKSSFSYSADPASPSRRKGKTYGSLMPVAVETQAVNALAAQQNTADTVHSRTRSISDFVPEQLHNVKQRVATFGPTQAESAASSRVGSLADKAMHREEYLAPQRGHPTKQLPSPPPSNKSVTESEADDDDGLDEVQEDGVEYFTLHSGPDNHKRKWRAVRQLGQGTFSKVLLASSQRLSPGLAYTDDNLNPRRLVAVKVVEHGPAGGADEERINISLKREIDFMKSVAHPSIVQLKALEETPTRALLVLTYCPGGDLFELASQRRDLLTQALVQRIFAELVSAVQYLHQNWIVHRDIKLENVLVNLPAASLTSTNLPHPQSTPHPLVTLTDLGLSRRIPAPPTSPLLTTRCGSEDYAAPEILLGQPYDGRSTDAWALGVLLYALVEGRLPFDAPPGRVDRSRNTHRIARCDWIWCRFGDEDGEWVDRDTAGPEALALVVAAGEWEGARGVVEGLLKKVRMGRKTLDQIAGMQWVARGLDVEGGLTARGDLEG